MQYSPTLSKPIYKFDIKRMDYNWALFSITGHNLKLQADILLKGYNANC